MKVSNKNQYLKWLFMNYLFIYYSSKVLPDILILYDQNGKMKVLEIFFSAIVFMMISMI